MREAGMLGCMYHRHCHAPDSLFGARRTTITTEDGAFATVMVDQEPYIHMYDRLFWGEYFQQTFSRRAATQYRRNTGVIIVQ